MDIDQILKQMDWLDEERRKDKDMIAKQEDRIISMQGNMESAHQQIKELKRGDHALIHGGSADGPL